MSTSEFRTPNSEFAPFHMMRALELAERGRGCVEPNPLVGCVIVDDADQIVGEGFHTRFGAPHAEVEALRVAGARARGATMFVTLEPCCHQGKTPPCTQAVIAAGVKRVVIAMSDPFPQVAGGGVAELRSAGVEVVVGLLEDVARELNAPYLKLIATGRPWIIAKWAMTLDGKIATRTGDSKWISGEASRTIVHQLRGRVDAIVVGRGTAIADDPLLTARPSAIRVARRVIVDSQASLSSQSRLVQTAREIPVLVAVAATASAVEQDRLRSTGCEVFVCPGENHQSRLSALLDELGHRRMTNVLVEGGSELLGSLFDLDAIDEAHVFVAPKLVGGKQAPSPIAGIGNSQMAAALNLLDAKNESVGGDIYVHGRIRRLKSRS